MFELWALEETAFQSLMDIMRGADLAAISAQTLEIPDSTLHVKDGQAVIPIKGLLTKEPTGGLAALLFGESTSYPLIIAQLEEANRNPDVTQIILDIDSPGGNVNGMFDASRAIRESSKPVTANPSGLALSAAYVLAVQADTITSRNEADRVGSVGVLTRQFISDNIVTITSTKAPLKAPDLKTQEGIETVKEQLDMTHNLMVKEIAIGRGVDAEKVNRDFGRGMTLTSDIAIQRGMIDAIESASSGPGFDSNLFAATTGFQDFEIVDIKFNSSQAIKRIRESTGSQETPSEDYRQGFFWFDRKNASDFGSYKLPFADISDGKLVAVRKAINAAHAVMQGARGGVDIPDADREKVQKHIDRYRAKIEKMDKEKSNSKAGGKSMDLQAYFAEHPEGRKEVDALVEGKVKAAVSGERDRVVAHLASIEHSGEAVITAITEGKAYNGVAQAEYMNAAMKVQAGGKSSKDNPGKVVTKDEPGEGEKSNAVMGAAMDNLLTGK